MLLALKMGERSLKPRNEGRQPPDMGKGKEMDSPLKPPESSSVSVHPHFSPVKPLSDSNLWEHKAINLYYLSLVVISSNNTRKLKHEGIFFF